MKDLIIELYSVGILVDPAADLSPLAGFEKLFLQWCMSNRVRVVNNSVVRAFFIDLETEKAAEAKIKIEDHTSEISIKGDATDWVNYFNSRYNQIKQMIAPNIGQVYSIGSTSTLPSSRVSVIGMIYEQKTTPKGHITWILDDPTGSTKIVITKNSSAYKQATKVLKDAVVGVSGTVSRAGDCIFADEVKLPDIPPAGLKWPEGSSGKVVIISDTHIGSKYALMEKTEEAIREIRNIKGLRAVIHLGDLVDCRGVYPNQEDELIIKSIKEQYDEASRVLSGLLDVPVILLPGNHSFGGTGNKLPAPAIPKTTETGGIYKLKNVIPVSDPAEVVFDEKVRFLLTHGLSLHSIMSSYGIHPTAEGIIISVQAMLMHRHICPPYGMREAQITPTREDLLVIRNVPHLVATGHIHVSASGEYKGVKIIGAGSFQEETPYMKAQNISATPPSYFVVDLETGGVEHVPL